MFVNLLYWRFSYLLMPDQLFNRRDLIAYFVVAATGALSNLLVATILQEWFTISYKSALFAGYWFSFVVGYFLTRLFAFNGTPGNSFAEMARQRLYLSPRTNP